MLTPDRSAPIFRVYDIMMFVISVGVSSFLSGMSLLSSAARLRSDHSVSLIFAGTAVAGALAALATGRRIHCDLRKLVSLIPPA
jgi:hypothetical protein